MQRFLGCINFYHRFIPYLATVLAPLHALCSSVKTANARLEWTSSLSDSFADAKKALTAFVLLIHPSTDPSVSLSLTADTSDVAVGAVLSQGPQHCPLGFYSKKLSDAERKYSAFDKELLALYLSIKHFRWAQALVRHWIPAAFPVILLRTKDVNSAAIFGRISIVFWESSLSEPLPIIHKQMAWLNASIEPSRRG